jgi:hypothetical protein
MIWIWLKTNEVIKQKPINYGIFNDHYHLMMRVDLKIKDREII